MMQNLLQPFLNDSDFNSIVAGVKSGMKEQMVSGLAGSSKQVMITALYQQIEKPLLIVTHNLFSAQKIIEDLHEFFPKEQCLLFPANEISMVETAISSPETEGQRIEVLSKLSEGFRGIIVTPYAGIRRILPTFEAFSSTQFLIQQGQSIEIESFISSLIKLGYERVERVETRGEMSVRGGIVDFYPMQSAPYRVEWFGDDIDSIRSFDIESQRSNHTLEQLLIMPCKETFADGDRYAAAVDSLSTLLEQQYDKMASSHEKEQLKQHILHDMEQLKHKQHFDGIYKYISLLYPEMHTILNYVSSDTILLMDEPVRLLETAKQMEKDDQESISMMLESGKILPQLKMTKHYSDLMAESHLQQIYLTLFLRQLPQVQPQNIVNFMCRTMQEFHGQMNVLKSEMERWHKLNYTVTILASGKERTERLLRILEDYHIEQPNIINGNLHAGFEFTGANVVVITEGEIFSQKQKKRKTQQTQKIENAKRIKSYLELKEGDFVVHVNHGIGKFVGIGTLEVGGTQKDYMHIVYAGNDKLSVPIDQIDLVQKYVASEDKEPKLYKLGGTEWTKVKSKARKKVKDIAEDLIQLYAQRQESEGYTFSADTEYQKEFEAMFPYEETPDQLRSITEIKKDMQQPVPMDRLLCGDVGYGKTEVAIRCAFKSAIEGKQVAVLVPTTILAQQHYETFRERFSGYPFKIEVLSRFRSRKEQNATLKGVKDGTVDIVIGTHRLLSKDVVFNQLGLLIVDEEQRFGVSHKEKLKKLKANVDVLTLTATPIPRTLHMSMLGVRDLSVIETPPENRFPVQTYVVEHSQGLVREVIEREMARGGQVYYLYNRIQGIYNIADQITSLIPDAKVAVGHGQMKEQELEKTILDFLDGEYDVLVSTSIIETGVDIPNVNTLIVHDADKMGLSQLYQLRGRVGRSNRIAYAYFTYQRDKVLTEVAEKRLHAIKEFTELGSGFKIAMRDLAIRGAGNLLGAEQHGFIASVGFDLYSQMLSEEIEKRKMLMKGNNEQQVETISTQIDMDLDAYIPSEYIADSMHKIEIYKKIASIEQVEEATDIMDELIDRFGEPPSAVVNLVEVAKLRAFGQLYGIESIIDKNNEIVLTLHPTQNEKIHAQKLLMLCSTFEGKMKVIPGSEIKIAISSKSLSSDDKLTVLMKFFHQYDDILVKEESTLQHAVK
ncbi:transcription-repair coupling factor [Longirhabdus pacifica]|uniref:transcription-repair coupling factor n=1 Tax=Longirhabdus pacifica TaxID=2305227 RepID=UPI001008A37C|nr:transcription-repair coupling factor [Longirhabdus pacifica]